MKKSYALPALVAICSLLAACSPSTPTPPTPEDAMPPAAEDAMMEGTEETTETMETDTAPAEQPAAMEGETPAAEEMAASDVRVIDMTMTDWAFSQKELRLKKGEQVRVRLTNVKGDHSFTAADLGIDVVVEEGTTKEFVIPTETTGTFGFRCAIPCGPGHRDMTGQIIIEE